LKLKKNAISHAGTGMGMDQPTLERIRMQQLNLLQELTFGKGLGLHIENKAGCSNTLCQVFSGFSETHFLKTSQQKPRNSEIQLGHLEPTRPVQHLEFLKYP
jgi:hypothetical protein